MDVIKTARHRAGMQAAVYRVFVPMVLIAVIVFGVLLYIGYRNDDTLWLFVLLGCIEVTMPFMMVLAYLTARRNPKFLRKQLEEIIHCEEMLMPLYQKQLAKWTQELAESEESERTMITEAWVGHVQETKSRLERAVARLREDIERTTASEKIREQESFLRHNQHLRECEQFLARWESEGDVPAPEEFQQKMQHMMQKSLENLRQAIEKNKAVYQEKVSRSQQIVSEARDHLQGM